MTVAGAAGPGAVLVVGDVIDDVVVRPLAAAAHGTDTPSVIVASPGGSGANQAAWLAASGARVRFVGRVGTADVGRHASALQQAGVDARLVPDRQAPTGTVVVLVDAEGQRSMFTDRGANLGLSPQDLPDRVLDDVTLVHVSGYGLFHPGPRRAVLDLVARARAAGIPWSVDPSSTSYLAQVGPAAFLSWIAGAGLLFPNLDEGRLLTGRRTPQAVAERLLAHVPTVVVTSGADGALLAQRGREVLVRAAVGADVVDTTGAGDAFCGAFLSSWSQGAPASHALDDAVRAAARAVTIPGGRP